MSARDVIRSWKDPQFRASLSPSDRDRQPEHPAGIVEVPESQLTGAAQVQCHTALGCSWFPTYSPNGEVLCDS